MINFPEVYDAPLLLLALEGNCGPLSAWMVLKYFRKRVSSKDLLAACHYTRLNGTYTIGLAVALRGYGLDVSFYSELDQSQSSVERSLYKKAIRNGVNFRQAITIDNLLRKINEDYISIVYFEASRGIGHFSPLIGNRNRSLLLTYTENGKMNIKKFKRKWNAAGYCRQCILIHRQL